MDTGLNIKVISNESNLCHSEWSLSCCLIIIRGRGIRGNHGLNLKINFIDGQCLMRGHMDDNAKYQSQSNRVHKYLTIIAVEGENRELVAVCACAEVQLLR